MLAPNGKVVFAPYRTSSSPSKKGGVFDPVEDTFTAVDFGLFQTDYLKLQILYAGAVVTSVGRGDVIYSVHYPVLSC